MHIPVLVDEVLNSLMISSGGTYLDATFGEGGHTHALIKGGAQHVTGLDRDPIAIASYRESGHYKDDPRLSLSQATFNEWAAGHKEETFDGVLVDLGVSTRQLLEGQRGFSLKNEGPLDMRMDPKTGQSLAEILESWSPEALIEAIHTNTDWYPSRAVQRRLAEAMEAGTLTTTQSLVDLFPPRHGKAHPATRFFLGLRMLVNQEMAQIEKGLPALFRLLKPGGRLSVISFHSTEDRLVKNIFKQLCGKCVCEQSPCICDRLPKASRVTKKPLTATREECLQNPRARSAKLRCIEKNSRTT